LARRGTPTAFYAVHTEVDAALAYVREKGAPIVIKADGLAAGKGVIVAMTLDEAEAAVRDMLAGNAFGTAGARVVIEEFLDGEEASFISIVDGSTALPMATSQDHKRVGDGDTGPNTGGMGAYSPAPVVTPEVHARIMREVVEPTVRGMAADGVPFTGFLYTGLMIDATGAPKVIEFNVRFGDPETQPVMMRLRSDLAAHGKRFGPGAGIQLDAIGADRGRVRDIAARVGKQADPAAQRAEPGDQRPQRIAVAGKVEAVVGGELRVGVGDQGRLRRAHPFAQGHEAGIAFARRGEGIALQGELDAACTAQVGQRQHVVVAGVAGIGARVHGNAVRAGIQAGAGGAQHVGIAAAARIAQHRDLVEVDAEVAAHAPP